MGKGRSLGDYENIHLRTTGIFLTRSSCLRFSLLRAQLDKIQICRRKMLRTNYNSESRISAQRIAVMWSLEWPWQHTWFSVSQAIEQASTVTQQVKALVGQAWQPEFRPWTPVEGENWCLKVDLWLPRVHCGITYVRAHAHMHAHFTHTHRFSCPCRRTFTHLAVSLSRHLQF